MAGKRHDNDTAAAVANGLENFHDGPMKKTATFGINKMTKRFTAISLFCGAGGLDIGFERAGFKTIWANDFDKDACRTHETWSDATVVCGDIGKIGTDEIPDADIMLGGFPCQGFSLSGPRKLDDRRNRLYQEYVRIVSAKRPLLFVGENVKGLVSLGDVKDILERDFAMAGDGGYLVVPARVLYAPSYGVPQTRERVFFFGFKKSALRSGALSGLSEIMTVPDITVRERYDPYPPITHGKGYLPFATSRDAFAGLEEPEASPDICQQRYSHAKYMGSHCQGQTEVNLDAPGPTVRSEHHGNIEFRRLSALHGGTHTEELAQGLQERRLTVRECARLQTFPDDYRFIRDKGETGVAVSASDAYKLIGNAVPPVLAYAIARNLEKKWELYFL